MRTAGTAARQARGSVAEGRARARTHSSGQGDDDVVAVDLTTSGDDGVTAASGEAGDDREVVTGGGR